MVNGKRNKEGRRNKKGRKEGDGESKKGDRIYVVPRRK
jgi:hypothetical protein